jgi:predicted choloylglycine hydrolase
MLKTTFKARYVNLKSYEDGSFKRIFNEHWPAYKAWYQAKLPDAGNSKILKQAEKKLANSMPEMLPIYENLREVSNDCPVAAHFFTAYQPPAYLVNCSQAILIGEEPLLIRNYDLSPTLSENLISQTDCLGQSIIGTNECLWGLDDGMNQAGLAASLTFGGSKKVGKGFGIPYIMRYVLQTCETVKQAISVLQRIPSHMAYNVTLLDKNGNFATVMLAPDQPAIVTREPCITNHQQHITWPEQAAFSKTIERKEFLDKLLAKKMLKKSKLREAFLNKPLHSTNFTQNFGTVFTAIYQPAQGDLSYHWPTEKQLKQSFEQFIEQDRIVDLGAISSQKTHDTYQQLPTSDSIPKNVRKALLISLDFLPSHSSKQRNSLIVLKQHLKTDYALSWVEYGMRLDSIYRHACT